MEESTKLQSRISEFHNLELLFSTAEPSWYLDPSDFTFDEFILCSPTGINEYDPLAGACVHTERNSEEHEYNLMVDTNALQVNTANAMVFTQRNGLLEFVKHDGSTMCVGFDKGGRDWSRRFASIRDDDKCPFKFQVYKEGGAAWMKTTVGDGVCIGSGKKVLIVINNTPAMGEGQNRCLGGIRSPTAFGFQINVARSKQRKSIQDFESIGLKLRYATVLGALRLNIMKYSTAGVRNSNDVALFENLKRDYKRMMNAFLPIYQGYLSYTKFGTDQWIDSSFQDMVRFRDALNDDKDVTMYIPEYMEDRLEAVGNALLK